MFFRLACEFLRSLDLPEVTGALVKWAVFETDADNRAAAVNALRERNKQDVTRLLLQYVRYPWPRAVEHAAEALVALDCQEALPRLIAAYDQPDPAAPFRVELPNQAGGTFRLELVRINHAKNCAMCHPSSVASDRPLQGAVPDPSRPLPPPNGYSRGSPDSLGGSEFVRADITYLKQDFSVVQPVRNPGNWPLQQRYDYFVSVRRENDQQDSQPLQDDSYRQAIRFAIVELSQHDPATDLNWMAEQRQLAESAEESLLGDIAKFVSLERNPEALDYLKGLEFTKPLMSVGAEDLGKTVAALQKGYGAVPARLAFIAYLDPLTHNGQQANRELAARLLAVAMSDTSDAKLSTAMMVAMDDREKGR